MMPAMIMIGILTAILIVLCFFECFDLFKFKRRDVLKMLNKTEEKEERNKKSMYWDRLD